MRITSPFQQALFQPVRLGLHAVDKDAPDILAIQAAAFPVGRGYSLRYLLYSLGETL